MQYPSEAKMFLTPATYPATTLLNLQILYICCKTQNGAVHVQCYGHVYMLSSTRSFYQNIREPVPESCTQIFTIHHPATGYYQGGAIVPVPMLLFIFLFCQWASSVVCWIRQCFSQWFNDELYSLYLIRLFCHADNLNVLQKRSSFWIANERVIILVCIWDLSYAHRTQDIGDWLHFHQTPCTLDYLPHKPLHLTAVFMLSLVLAEDCMAFRTLRSPNVALNDALA